MLALLRIVAAQHSPPHGTIHYVVAMPHLKDVNRLSTVPVIDRDCFILGGIELFQISLLTSRKVFLLPDTKLLKELL